MSEDEVDNVETESDLVESSQHIHNGADVSEDGGDHDETENDSVEISQHESNLQDRHRRHHIETLQRRKHKNIKKLIMKPKIYLKRNVKFSQKIMSEWRKLLSLSELFNVKLVKSNMRQMSKLKIV